MADACSTAEFEVSLTQLKGTITETTTLLTEESTITPATVRRLILRLQKQIDLVEKFKPARSKEDVFDYATKAVALVY